MRISPGSASFRFSLLHQTLTLESFLGNQLSWKNGKPFQLYYMLRNLGTGLR